LAVEKGAFFKLLFFVQKRLIVKLSTFILHIRYRYLTVYIENPGLGSCV